mgnify:CR=1 FL=1
MIISASRRTDIPTYYSKWFFNRLKDGYVYVRNPMNIHQISSISLSPDVVDGIVFWTKNPIPMFNKLDELKNYSYYFQFTLNPYGKDIEPNVPSKKDIIIPAFQQLSKEIGKDRVVWRYDPIFLNEKYNMEYHLKYFEILAEKLSGYTEKCTISFLDIYKNIQRNISPLRISVPSTEHKLVLMQEFSRIAQRFNLYIDTCAENIDLSKYNIGHACCVDKQRFERIGNYILDVGKDKNQRLECGCISSIDIGAYNTCKNGCIYCYANFSQNSVVKNNLIHDPSSPLLFGNIGENDIIKTRKISSCKNCQISLF